MISAPGRPRARAADEIFVALAMAVLAGSAIDRILERFFPQLYSRF